MHSGDHPTETTSAGKIDLLRAATDAAARYIATEREARVAPATDRLDALDALDVPLDTPLPAEAVLALLDDAGRVGAVRSTGGRYFGFVNGGVEPAALAAATLAGAWDQNAALPVMSPVAARADELAAHRVVELLGLPSESIATFCAGATVANLTAIVTARDELLRREGWSVAERGLAGAPPIRVVVGDEVHVSAVKALRVAGFGNESIERVPTDRNGRIRADAMPAIGGPALVLLQAGNVNTGHSDPFAEIIGGLDRDRTWVHVDGAFGLWARVAPARRHLVAGVELADSWATDAHKWLNAPYDCGVLICRDRDALARAMRMDAAYVATTDDRALLNLGIQMSQAARAVPVWAILATLGREGIADAVERCCRLATRMADRLAAGGVEILAPVVLNQVLVAFGDDAATDAVVSRVQQSGACWMGSTTWQGRRAMRISVSDTATVEADIDTAAAAVLAATT